MRAGCSFPALIMFPLMENYMDTTQDELYFCPRQTVHIPMGMHISISIIALIDFIWPVSFPIVSFYALYNAGGGLSINSLLAFPINFDLGFHAFCCCCAKESVTGIRSFV